MTDTPLCRWCAAPLTRTLVDLGLSPLANAFVAPERAAVPDPFYPLHARVCDACRLVQVDDVVPAEAIFNETYAYFSSFSSSWLAHCRRFAEAATRERLERWAVEPEAGGPAEAAAWIGAAHARWGRVARDTGMRVN